MRVHGRRAGLLGQFFAALIHCNRQVRVAGRRQPQPPLQQDLPRRGRKEIGPAHNVGYALFRIVDCDGEGRSGGALPTFSAKCAATCQAISSCKESTLARSRS